MFLVGMVKNIVHRMLEWPKLWNGVKRGERMNKKIFGFSPAFELRTSSDGNKLALEGRAIVFNQPTVLGNMTESNTKRSLIRAHWTRPTFQT